MSKERYRLTSNFAIKRAQEILFSHGYNWAAGQTTPLEFDPKRFVLCVNTVHKELTHDTLSGELNSTWLAFIRKYKMKKEVPVAYDSWTVSKAHKRHWSEDLCDECKDCCGEADLDDCCEGCHDCDCDGRRAQAGHVANKPIISSTKTGGSNMNRTIAKLFEKTVDAVLVNKFYGHIIADNDIEAIKLAGKQKEILAAAQELQDKQDAAANVVKAKVVA